MQQTKRPNAKTTPAPAAPAAADDDAVPQNIDEFRNELARRINRFIGDRAKYWRGCRERVCRRQRACLAPRIHCSNAPALPPSTPEQQARALALVQRTLREVGTRREAGE